MLTRWQPYGDARTEMQRLHEEMNRLFGRYGRHTNGAREFSHGVYPPLNLWEDAGKLYIEAELPGFKLEDLDIYVTGENQLSIKGERKPLELREELGIARNEATAVSLGLLSYRMPLIARL